MLTVGVGRIAVIVHQFKSRMAFVLSQRDSRLGEGRALREASGRSEFDQYRDIGSKASCEH